MLGSQGDCAKLSVVRSDKASYRESGDKSDKPSDGNKGQGLRGDLVNRPAEIEFRDSANESVGRYRYSGRNCTARKTQTRLLFLVAGRSVDWPAGEDRLN